MRIRTNSLTISIALLISLLLSPVGLAGQTPNAPTGDWSRLSAVTAGSKLSVKQKNGKTVEGKLIAVSDAGLSLSVNGKSVDVKQEDVSSVSQTTKKSATKATLIGLGVGAGAGAGIGLAGSGGDNFANLDHAVTAGLTVLGFRSWSLDWIPDWQKRAQESPNLSSRPALAANLRRLMPRIHDCL